MKKFKMAQIVPVSHLEDIKDNQYHMCLAHLVPQSKEYRHFYERMSAEGKFVLMDNGAAEDSQMTFTELLNAFKKINPTEIVVPDTLCNSKSTLDKTASFIRQYGDLPYRFMGVPQGKTLTEWTSCAAAMLAEPRINTIGVSKFLNIATGDNYIRVSAVQALQSLIAAFDRYDIEVHLLGCDEGPAPVRHIKECYPFVRGCDSAFTYIGSKAGAEFSPDMERPEGKIDFIYGKRSESFVADARMFEQECLGISDNGKDYSWR